MDRWSELSGRATADAEFTAHRPLLFSIAYEILGSIADTEDVLQDSYLRWRKVDRSLVDNPRAYMAQIVARQSLMMLRSASRRREDYIGPWLPEPLATATGAETPDGPAHVLTGEAVTTAMLLVLETLTPEQRAVFVLREVFDFAYDEIAAAIGKSSPAVRQINHRARKHVHQRQPAAASTPAAAQPTVDRFLAAIASGDIQALMDTLAPDVVALVDGGGVVSAVRRPVYGREKVARLFTTLLGLWRQMGEVEFRIGVYNGLRAVIVLINGEIDSLTCVEVRDGLIVAGYGVRNPSKLEAVRWA